jgi:hypothetical protein
MSAKGGIDAGWGSWLARAESVRGAAASAAGTATEAMLRAYGTTGSQACRRDSALFGILDVARRMRESVDRVVVVGDRADRALVDLLMSTCCHPRHDDLPRHERGGRPRIWTLGPGDDDDDVQGILDCLRSQIGDRLLDAWGVVQVGPCREAFTQDCVRLFAEGADPTGRQGAAPSMVVAAAVDHPGHIAVTGPAMVADAPIPAPPPEESAMVFSAAVLLPAAIAGIDVVRLLEGAAAMARRFREAPAEANPVVSLAIVGRWLAAAPAPRSGVPRRRLLPPPRWRGLVEWHSAQTDPPAPHAPAAIEGWFTTPITVAECRRAPFATIHRDAPGQTTDPSAHRQGLPTTADHLVLPRCDEHTLGQLLEGLRLAAAVEERLE